MNCVIFYGLRGQISTESSEPCFARRIDAYSGGKGCGEEKMYRVWPRGLLCRLVPEDWNLVASVTCTPSRANYVDE